MERIDLTEFSKRAAANIKAIASTVPADLATAHHLSVVDTGTSVELQLVGEARTLRLECRLWQQQTVPGGFVFKVRTEVSFSSFYASGQTLYTWAKLLSVVALFVELYDKSMADVEVFFDALPRPTVDDAMGVHISNVKRAERHLKAQHRARKRGAH